MQVIKNELSGQQIKTALQAFTFNYIDVDEKQFGIDGKQRHLKNLGRR